MSESRTQISDALAAERAAFEEMREGLEQHHPDKFVVIVGDKLEGTFDSFDSAAHFAMSNFGRGPYLIRRVGSPTSMPLPASVAYRALHADH